MNDDVTLLSLSEFPNRLADLYAVFPVEFVNWRPTSWEGVPSEPFTAIEQLCHVRDIEIDGYHVRLRRTLQEVHPHLFGIDSEAVAVERGYGRADAQAVLTAFRHARATTLTMLRDLSAEQWRRTAFFDGYGELTLRGLVHYLSSHDQQHLAGLQWLLGKIDAHRYAERF